MSIPNCTLQPWNDAPTVHVNGEPIPSVAYFCTEPTEARITAMRRAGVEIITWGVGGATAHCCDIGWKGPDHYDYQPLDDAAHVILEHHPDAWLLPRVATTAPKWWLEVHPEDNAIMSTGRAKGRRTGLGAAWCDDPRETVVSQASDRWQADCEAALGKLVAHIDASDWGHRCIGIQPNGGVNEWFVSHGHDWPDYGPLAVAAFRDWLAERGIEGAETAEPPSPEELKQGTWGGWYDPAAGEHCQNWWRFYHELNARRMLETCAAIKRVSQDRLIVGAFYGYIGDSYANSEPAAWLYGHHHSLGEVTAHPAVDYLAAPFSYNNRQPGGTPESQIPTASCDLAGCFTFTENDLGTFLSVKDESPAAIEKTMGTMVRDQGQRIIRRQGFWWMDLLPLNSDWPSDWYTHPTIEGWIHSLTALQAEEASRPPSKWRAQIAVVLGNDSPFHCRTGHPSLPEWVTHPLRNVLPAIGAPIDVLVLDDLVRENLPDYRLFIFLDVPCVTPSQRETVHRVLTEQKATAYFHGLPGLIDGQTLDVSGCSALTGIDLRLFGGGEQAGQGRRVSARFCDFGHPLVADVPPSTTLGGYPSDAFGIVIDADAQTIGTMSLKGRPSVAVKEIAGGWTSVYSSFAGAPPVFFRNLARQAGAHIFTDCDAVVDACDNLLLVHQIGPGPVRLQLHRPWEVAVDRITGVRWPVEQGTVLLDGPHGRSHLLGPVDSTPAV